MAREFDPHRLSNPSLFLLSMVIFLIIVGFLVAVLYRQILSAFETNPGLNGLIIGVLIVGILLALVQVIRLIPEVRWVNAFRSGNPDLDIGREPVLLAPMKALLGQSREEMSISTLSMRSILDSIGNRLDESRDISRYLIGLLVFLGLLGTFWGLLQTIGSIGDTIQSLDPGSGNANDVLDALKAGLRTPLEGMGTAFSSSLFGLAGSLVLGFLDLQAGRAQTRFYTELENWLTSVTDTTSDIGSSIRAGEGDVRTQLEQMNRKLSTSDGSKSNEVLAGLVGSIQQMVRHMRSEQELTRKQLQQQAIQQKEMMDLMQKLNTFFEKASKP
ncbi:MAG: MotA/TolQ/ExbB proton channel family protein [Pseudomonadota bacterium]